jgi:hypothetical protein
MPEDLGSEQIRSILELLGERIQVPARLFLVGGGALALLGSPRLTIDIDFIGDDVSPSTVDKAIIQTAKELHIYVEAVALERFIPMPAGSQDRAIHIGQFGNLEVYVADPYSIALSKLDRGFDTDIDDIIFLIQHGYIELAELKHVMDESLLHAREFDMDAAGMPARLQIVRARMK